MQSNRLKFVGSGDEFFPGIPQSELSVVDEPGARAEVSPEQAKELIESGLYEFAEEEG